MEARSYRFGPLERRGILGALAPERVVTAALALLVALVIVSRWPTELGLLLAVIVLGAAGWSVLVPLRGRTAAEWAPVLVSFVRRRWLGEHRFNSTAPWRGVRGGPEPGAAQAQELVLPPSLQDLELLAMPCQGWEVGVVKDRRDHTYTAVLAVRVRSFGLLALSEQERRLAAWGQVLASLARPGSPVRRLQWLERTVPSDGDELQRYLVEARDRAVPVDDPARSSYEELIHTAGQVTQDHELFVAVQIDGRRAWRQVRHVKDRDTAAGGVLVRELAVFADRLRATEVEVDGALQPRMLARAFRLAFDPYGRTNLSRLAVADPDREGVDPALFGPITSDEDWSTYRTDGAWHRTYWVAQWPRLPVGAGFLSPLLLRADAVRTVSITMEVIPPDKATADVESAVMQEESDEQLRRERGFRTTARRRRQHEATNRREEELAAGHQEVRYTGHVTTSARDPEGLELSCEAVLQAAQQAHLHIEPVWGAQADAFTATLPLARGLR